MTQKCKNSTFAYYWLYALCNKDFTKKLKGLGGSRKVVVKTVKTPVFGAFQACCRSATLHCLMSAMAPFRMTRKCCGA